MKFLFAILGIVSGAFIWLAGRLFLKYIVFVTIVLSTISATDAILVLIANTGTSTVASLVYWLVFAVSGLCGLLLAWLFTTVKSVKAFGPLTMAAWMGFVLGNAISHSVFFATGESINAFWAIIVTSSVLTVIIVSTNISHHMIWVTAIFGSYLFLISFSIFTDMRWPLDLNLPELYAAGAVTKESYPHFSLYMGLWALMTVTGLLVQCYTLWHFKKSGKVLRWAEGNEAIKAFKFGRTAS